MGNNQERSSTTSDGLDLVMCQAFPTIEEYFNKDIQCAK